MIIETAIGTALVGSLFAQVNKSIETDDKALKKNIKALTKMAEAENKLERCQQNAVDKLMICAKRKKGILYGQIRLFQEQFELIRKVEFKQGQGIEELEKFDEVLFRINQSVTVAEVRTDMSMTKPQTLLSFALFGIGGLMIKESEMNLKIASKNAAQANVMVAQVDSVCIALDGLANHAEIVTQLLQKLGALYMQSVRNVTEIIERNGRESAHYTKSDMDSINLSLLLTKVIYRIINTPMIDENGAIEQESREVIAEGEECLKKIGNVRVRRWRNV